MLGASDTSQSEAAPTLDGFATIEIEVGEERLTVAVAETSGQRSQGLQRAESLPDGMDGMLFVFEEPRTARFLMNDTLIPLDIWWFDGDGVLLETAEMEPCAADPCERYPSPGEVVWVLETPLGATELETGASLTVLESS